MFCGTYFYCWERSLLCVLGKRDLGGFECTVGFGGVFLGDIGTELEELIVVERIGLRGERNAVVEGVILKCKVAWGWMVDSVVCVWSVGLLWRGWA